MSPLSLLLFARRQDECPDKTPAAVNWGNPVWDIGDASGTVTSQRITGTSCGIRIRTDITWPPLPEDDGDSIYEGEVWVRVTDSEITNVVGTPEGDGFNQITNGSEFDVDEGKWVSFMAKNPPSGTTDNKTIDANVSVVNVSDGDAVLDTFIAQVRD